MATETGNKPVKVLRLRGVKVSVFANHATTDGRDVLYHKTTVQKIYREGDDWKTSTSLSRDDLPIATLLLQRAWEFILETEAVKPAEQAEVS